MANKRKGDTSETAIDRIERYVIAHPLCVAADVSAGTGLNQNTVAMNLTRLRLHGRIRRVIEQVGSRRVVRLEAGIEEGVILADSTEGQPKQIIVTSWTPHMHRDPFVAAIHPL